MANEGVDELASKLKISELADERTSKWKFEWLESVLYRPTEWLVLSWFMLCNISFFLIGS